MQCLLSEGETCTYV